MPAVVESASGAAAVRLARKGLNKMETEMRMIMVALAACAVLAGTAAPASAGSGVKIWLPYGYAGPLAPEARRYAKPRRYVEPQVVYDADKLPIGTDTWWQQMDREQRGGRR
jgi:hypothetical protein